MCEHGFFLNDWQKNHLPELYPDEQEKIKAQSGQVFFWFVIPGMFFKTFVPGIK